MSIAQHVHESVCFFVVPQAACSVFASCHDKVPNYSQLLVQAAAAGEVAMTDLVQWLPMGWSGVLGSHEACCL